MSMQHNKRATLTCIGFVLTIAVWLCFVQPVAAYRNSSQQDSPTPTDTATPDLTLTPTITATLTPIPLFTPTVTQTQTPIANLTPTDTQHLLYLPYILAIRNTAPLILGAPAGLTVDEDTTVTVTLVISDAQDDVAGLIFSATPLTPTLINSIAISGTLDTRTLIITPAQNVTGDVPITLTVSDGQLQSRHLFVLTLLPLNDAPVLRGLRDIGVRPNLTRTLEFTVTDVESDTTALNVSIEIENQTLLPLSNVSLLGQGVTRTLALTPTAGLSGTSIISVSASDGALTSIVPITLTVSPDVCPDISTNSYITIAIQPDNTGSLYYKNNRLTDENVDFRLSLLGYTDTNALKDLVDYGGDVDPFAPRIYGVFKPKRTINILQTYKRFDWNWNEDGPPPYGTRGGVNNDWAASVIDLGTATDEQIYIPERPGGLFQTGIWEGDYKALVLYAAESELLVTYTRNDRVDHGYALYLSNLCVDVNLVKAYRDQLSKGKRSTGWLPALRNTDVLGTARGSALTIAVRDSGSFLDPRARKDWWQGY